LSIWDYPISLDKLKKVYKMAFFLLKHRFQIITSIFINWHISDF